MDSEVIETADTSSETSLTTIFTKIRAKTLESSSSALYRNSFSKDPEIRSSKSRIDIKITKGIGSSGAAGIFKSGNGRRRSPPIAKTTKTFEMRRKAGEAKAKEWAALSKEWSQKAKEARSTSKSSAGYQKNPMVKDMESTSKSAKSKISSDFSFRSSDIGAMKRLHDILYPPEKVTIRTKSVEVQTCRSDINENLIIGDEKILRPSPKLWAEILRNREEQYKKTMLKEVRKVPEHSLDEVNYQTNLKEFLETGTVKRYERQSAAAKLVEARKDVFRRPFRKPKSPPEMDLKKRMPRIEQELLGIFKGRT